MTERQLQTAILELARMRGFKACHFRAAQTSKGWRTAVEGDAGAPDVILAKGGNCWFLEVKSDTGKVSPAQREWHLALGGKCLVVRPKDWEEMKAWLLSN